MFAVTNIDDMLLLAVFRAGSGPHGGLEDRRGPIYGFHGDRGRVCSWCTGCRSAAGGGDPLSGVAAAAARQPLGGHRLYPVEAVAVLRVIKAAQRLGFTLDEVTDLIDGGRHHHSRRHDTGLRSRAQAKLAEVQARIADLQVIAGAMRAALGAGCDDLVACAGEPCCPVPFATFAASTNPACGSDAGSPPPAGRAVPVRSGFPGVGCAAAAPSRSCTPPPGGRRVATRGGCARGKQLRGAAPDRWAMRGPVTVGRGRRPFAVVVRPGRAR